MPVCPKKSASSLRRSMPATAPSSHRWRTGLRERPPTFRPSPCARRLPSSSRSAAAGTWKTPTPGSRNSNSKGGRFLARRAATGRRKDRRMAACRRGSRNVLWRDPMRVLIVDDDEIARDLLSEALSGAGYEVSAARNGREALEILRTGVFRLVISDWEMPEMNGLELCRRIRERHFSSYVYLILVTSRDGTDNVVEGLNAGADDFITQAVSSGRAVRSCPFGRAIALAGKPQSHYLHARQAGRVAKSRNRRSPGADAGVLPGAGRAPLPQGEVLRRNRRRLRAPYLSHQPPA